MLSRTSHENASDFALYIALILSAWPELLGGNQAPTGLPSGFWTSQGPPGEIRTQLALPGEIRTPLALPGEILPQPPFLGDFRTPPAFSGDIQTLRGSQMAKSRPRN